MEKGDKLLILSVFLFLTRKITKKIRTITNY